MLLLFQTAKRPGSRRYPEYAEYGLLIALIAGIALDAVSATGTKLSTLFSSSASFAIGLDVNASSAIDMACR